MPKEGNKGFLNLYYPFVLQADVEISFQTTAFEKAEVLDSIWTNPQFLCSQKGASVKGALGPFGLLVLASNGLQEYTAVLQNIQRAGQTYSAHVQ